MTTELLYGRNVVCEALRARRRTLKRLLLSSSIQPSGPSGSIPATIIHLAEGAGVPVERVDRRVLDRQLGDVNHQGVVLEVGGYPYVALEDCFVVAQQRGEAVFLLLLDHVQDPQNVGTLLRTAEVVGVHGVLIPNRRAAEITPAVVSASSGATEHLPIAMIGNLAQTIKRMQDSDIWVVGVEDDEHAKVFDAVDLNVPLALVMGAEGKGLAHLTRTRCDFLIRLPMRGHLASLNVAVAGSIVLYAAWRQRGDR